MPAQRYHLGAADIARLLAQRLDALVRDLLPAGRQESAEWRCGSLAGDVGHSLGVCLRGAKRGLWCDFATGHRGDALDLVAAVLHLGMAGALDWSRHWLGIEAGVATLPSAPPARAADHPRSNEDLGRWQRPWDAAVTIAGTLAETYLVGRGLTYRDPDGDVLRFASRRWRRHPNGGALECHPALLALLRDVRDGEPCGVINVFLRTDGTDRLRDRKGKTTTGRARGAAAMLSAYDDVTLGLTLCEGAETGIALLMAGLAPVWALGGAGNVAALPVLAGIDALTIAADADNAGRRAASSVAERWCDAGRHAVIIAPPTGDWAEPGMAA